MNNTSDASLVAEQIDPLKKSVKNMDVRTEIIMGRSDETNGRTIAVEQKCDIILQRLDEIKANQIKA